MSAIMWKNADKLRKNVDKLHTNADKLQKRKGMKKLQYRKVISTYLFLFMYSLYYIFQSRESTYGT